MYLYRKRLPQMSAALKNLVKAQSVTLTRRSASYNPYVFTVFLSAAIREIPPDSPVQTRPDRVNYHVKLRSRPGSRPRRPTWA
jgi:hypothetical protein